MMLSGRVLAKDRLWNRVMVVGTVDSGQFGAQNMDLGM
jgi:hypothetical protein